MDDPKPPSYVPHQNLPYHQARVRQAVASLINEVMALHSYSHPHLVARAEYQIKRELAGLDRYEGSGPTDPQQLQFLEDQPLGEEISFHWDLTPASGKIHKLVIRSGYRERFEHAEVELTSISKTCFIIPTWKRSHPFKQPGSHDSVTRKSSLFMFSVTFKNELFAKHGCLKDKVAEEKAAHLEQRINEAVFALYGLETAEIELVQTAQL